MTTKTIPTADAVANRRRQLQRWIDEKFNGVQTAFIASTNDGQKQLNQGELSGLLKTKSFGEKRAHTLEIQAHMPPGYLDQRTQHTNTTTKHIAQEPIHGAIEISQHKLQWPFKLVSYKRLSDLERLLGKQQHAEAMASIDEHLDVLITKLEKKSTADKRRITK